MNKCDRNRYGNSRLAGMVSDDRNGMMEVPGYGIKENI